MIPLELSMIAMIVGCLVLITFLILYFKFGQDKINKLQSQHNENQNKINDGLNKLNANFIEQFAELEKKVDKLSKTRR